MSDEVASAPGRRLRGRPGRWQALEFTVEEHMFFPAGMPRARCTTCGSVDDYGGHGAETRDAVSMPGMMETDLNDSRFFGEFLHLLAIAVDAAPDADLAPEGFDEDV